MKCKCAVVKNTNNCPYPSTELCQESTASNLYGVINARFGTITLHTMRYNVKRINQEVLDDHLCIKCHVIWSIKVNDDQGMSVNCPICKR